MVGSDFVQSLVVDTSAAVLACLNDCADLVRASAVSHTWRRFVIENGFCKNLVLRLYPEASIFAQVIEMNNSFEPIVVSSNSNGWERLEKEHRIYAFLSQYLNSCAASRDCVLHTVAASSTDNYPHEGIEHTLEPSNPPNMMPSYWSSKGAKDPRVPETLTYRLRSNLCIVDQINICPFEAHFQVGNPIYSAQAVRFRMGHSALLQETNNADKSTTSQQSSGDTYIWTYVSPTFPMVQENKLQSFKLPRPVLCTGGILQIEFLGRVQLQEADGLYYICICYVQVLGRPSPPMLDVGHFDNSEQLTLRYLPHAQYRTSCETSRNEQEESSEFYNADDREPSGWHTFAERLGLRATMRWNEMILGTFLGAGNVDDDSDEDTLA